MYKNLKIGTKILVTFLSIAIVSVSITGYFAYTRGKTALEEDSFNKLTAVREMKAHQIEDYFQQITDQVITFSEDLMIIDAMKSFQQDYHNIDSELGVTDTVMAALDVAVVDYYENEFIERLVPNLLKDVAVEDYWPEGKNSRILQYLYTASNPNESGSKHLLNDAGDNSSYSATHAAYHPIIRNYLDRFGYYDIFLVDLDGNIVYTVFKEVDYGTSLLTGPYSETNFASAFKAARDATSREFTYLVDFEPYQPSYDAPASFIASPIFDDEEKIGVLLFQMPIDRINDIMTNNEKWSDVGLGESGETYIVGEDFTLRNQSRFLIEDSDNYFKMLEEVGTSILTIGRIRNLNTTIGLQQVKTDGTEAALSGEAGVAIFPDYRNIPVLSSYKPLSIPEVNWAIMSEIDEAEAFNPVFSLRNGIAAFLLGATALIVVAAVLFSRSITQPLKELTAYSHELSQHDFKQTGSFQYSGDLAEIDERNDEIGDLASAFEVMQSELELSIASLVESTAAKERMQSELNIGREIQMSMLPLMFPAFPDHDEFTVFAKLLPAREVGGDWYDFFFIDEDLFCFCIGDVSGKGVPSALFMAVAKTLIKSRAAEDKSTASIITHLNDELSVENKSFMFATIFIGILNVRTGDLLYTNAAHNPPYVKGLDGSVRRLDGRHGLVVGPLRDSTYEEAKFVLAEGDIFLLYTDGVTEAMDPAQNLFSDKRLATLFASTDYKSMEEVVESTLSAVKQFEAGSDQADDITVLAIQFSGAGQQTADATLDLTIQNQISEINSVNLRFDTFAEEQHIPPSIVGRMHMVFEELLSNIIMHGYSGENDHDIVIKVQASPQRLKVTIVDDGVPFNPLDSDTPDITLSLEEREIGGLGVHLVRTMMDNVSYERDGENNVVIVVKNITSEQG